MKKLWFTGQSFSEAAEELSVNEKAAQAMLAALKTVHSLSAPTDGALEGLERQRQSQNILGRLVSPELGYSWEPFQLGSMPMAWARGVYKRQDDWRCVFLMDRTGAPKQVGDWPDLDMSIYADCFVIAGLACYSRAAEDAEAYVFARKLYQSAKNRFETGCFKTLPYPLGKGLRAHGVPMIFTNVAVELYRAAERFEPAPVSYTHLGTMWMRSLSQSPANGTPPVWAIS